jgi:undecaprenyl-diphosphatase
MSTEPRGLTEQPATVGAAGQDRQRADGTVTDHGDVRTLVAWYVIAIAGLLGFVAMTLFIAGHGVFPFDGPLLERATSYSAYNGLWNLISNAANLPLIAIGVGLVVWLFVKHQRREAILTILILVAVTAGSEAIKQLIARPRPPGSDTVVPGVVYSYPSGHVLEATTIFGIIAILLWRSSQPLWLRAGFAIAVVLFIASVAIARVAIDAHYPSDVLAGLLAGVGVLGLFAVLTSDRHPATHGTDGTDAPN